MHSGIINFASSTALNIKDTEVKKEILSLIENLCKVKIIQKHFDKLDNNSILKLNNSPHLVSLKTNGNSYLCFLTRINFVNQCIFIDKKIQQGYFVPRMIITRFEFAEELFDNTLLDGEMIKCDTDNNWIFLINDVLVYKNQYLENINFLKRLGIVNDIMNTKFRSDKNDICNIQIKKYVTYDKIKYLVEDFSSKLTYTCRGLYFKPLYLKFKDILYNFDDSLIKNINRVKYQTDSLFISNKVKISNDKSITPPLKPTNSSGSLKSICSANSLNTIDSVGTGSKVYLIEKTELPDVYNLYDLQTMEKKGIACIPYVNTSKFLFEIFQNTNLTNKIKMECEYSTYFDKWIPLKIIEAN
jgi:hypothetical protein